MNEPNRTLDARELSTGELVSRLSEQVSRLVRDELSLAKVELKDKGKQAGVGAALGGSAGVLAWFGVAALMITAIAALALVLPTWAAALIVAGVLFAVAAVLGMVAVKKVKHATPPIPEQAIDSTRRDVEAVKESAHR
ncbi:putative integral membrane protein [Actinokineospora spheciospongiae]|uniref:Putative integral membrane protein n=1 Tax=Actinokineospora spheciospongiae TaxID=909613 RepID=W7JD40_9PSEU|nr:MULTISPECIES: phage holin family protein [Actinokineospora]EWC63924.1 putative integral membrane protein [Actinokineospora spheciospongiae]MCG8920326.1 phage holin family protein [Actinokineospora sp. PR83]PWW50847.1 putative superfamily III holin-X [Actinokineospora spheciospongiae]